VKYENGEIKKEILNGKNNYEKVLKVNLNNLRDVKL